jgi:hypothetical protein
MSYICERCDDLMVGSIDHALSCPKFKRAADHYGIDMEEASRRYHLIVAQGDNPEDPICVGCAKRPHEIESYRMDPKDDDTTMRLYCIYEEGTYNERNGHFLCDFCYIANGMPSSPNGWVCP